MSASHIPSFELVYRDSGDQIASLKRFPEDFVVEELWQPVFTGEGEHLYLFVEKVGQNTPWVADKLAKAFGVSKKDVGYSGLKDRHAIAKQWFSAPVPINKEPAALTQIEPEIEGVTILKRARHSTKLRRGTHSGNHFKIRLRDLGSQSDSDLEKIETRIEAIKKQGFPNYFGLQRFGHNGNNLRAGMQLSRRRKLVGHAKRGIYLSAMRSALFNQVLAAQVRAGNWQQISTASAAATGPMWGRGRPLKAEVGAEIEDRVVSENADLCDILEHGGLAQERRPLVQQCGDLKNSIDNGDLLLEFSLSPGSYATVLINEIVAIREETDQ